MQKVVVLGATSGIVQPLLRMMAKDGKEFLLVARSQERLDTLRSDLLARGAAHVLTLEADLVTSRDLVLSFAKECFPDFDTLLLSYGSMLDQAACQTSAEYAIQELQTNLLSAVALLTAFVPHFESRKSGTIAVITSVAGDRGRRSNYVYGAAKGGLGVFLEGLRSRMDASSVRVLTIKPGPVATAMTANSQRLPFLVPPELVASDIYHALRAKNRSVIYSPARWKWIMRGVRIIPERIFKKLPM